MTVLVRLGDTYKIKKDAYDTQLKTVQVASLTEKLLTEYPYEFLGDKTKLFFDYDEKSEDATYITKTRNEIRNTLIKYADDFQNGFVFTECTDNPTKISFHVIFKKICINRVDFLPIDEQELFSQLVGHERFHYIDTQVYGKKTCFRLPYGTTGLRNLSDKLYPHIPYTHSTILLSDFSLTVADDTEVKVYSTQIERIMATELKECNTNNAQYEVHYDKVIQMLGMINLERFKVYNNWIALMVLMKTNDLPRDLFIQMSENSGYKYFDEASCIKAWKNCRVNNNFGLPLIIGWLKQDGVDIKKHFPLQSPLLQELMIGYYSQGAFTDYNIANTLFKHYKDNMYFTNSHGWIHYDGTKWVLGDQCIVFAPIMRFLSTELLEYLQNHAEKEYNKIINDTNTKSGAVFRDTLRKNINSLQSASKIKSVLIVAEGLFLNPNVLDTFDTKPHWFCFANQKAYDLKEKKVIDIVATDRILTTCGYDLPTRNEKDILMTNTIMNELVSIENYDSFMSCLSLFIYGDNINEAFVVWKGIGRNGKGVLNTLLKLMLGNYYCALPVEELTEHSKGAGRASSELAQARWARCLMSSEPDDQKKLIKTKINILTGRDPITVRHLHKECFTYVPHYVLGLMCNDIPKVSGGMTVAINNRMKQQEFKYHFVEKPDIDNPFEKKIDIHLKDKILDPSYRNGLFYLLADIWFKNKGKYVSCVDAEKEQSEYARDNNPIVPFLANYEESKQFIRMKEFQTEWEKEYNKLSPSKLTNLLQQAGIKVVPDSSHGNKIYLKRKEEEKKDMFRF